MSKRQSLEAALAEQKDYVKFIADRTYQLKELEEELESCKVTLLLLNAKILAAQSAHEDFIVW